MWGSTWAQSGSTLHHLHLSYSKSCRNVLHEHRICSILSLKAVRLSGSHIVELCGVNLGPVGPSDFLLVWYSQSSINVLSLNGTSVPGLSASNGKMSVACNTSGFHSSNLNNGDPATVCYWIPPGRLLSHIFAQRDACVWRVACGTRSREGMLELWFSKGCELSVTACWNGTMGAAKFGLFGVPLRLVALPNYAAYLSVLNWLIEAGVLSLMPLNCHV